MQEYDFYSWCHELNADGRFRLSYPERVALALETEMDQPEIDPDDIHRSSERLYLFSLSTKRRLPEELHNAMLLWSYSEEGRFYSKAYVEWADQCDKWAEMREKHRKREKFMERSLLLMMAACAVTIIAQLVL